MKIEGPCAEPEDASSQLFLCSWLKQDSHPSLATWDATAGGHRKKVRLMSRETPGFGEHGDTWTKSEQEGERRNGGGMGNGQLEMGLLM